MTDHSENLAYTKLIVDDLERMAVFYRNVCNLEEDFRIDSSMDGRPMTEIVFKPAAVGGSGLVIMRYLDGSRPTHGQAVLVFFTEDMDAFLTRVEQHGGELRERREIPGQKGEVAFWNDPEGNLVEVLRWAR